MADLRGLRCGDEDRERAAAVIRQALAEGRLGLDELDPRLDGVYAARTYGELCQQVADIPGGPERVLPAPPAPPAPSPAPVTRHRRRTPRQAIRAYLTTVACCWGLWAFSVAASPQHAAEAIWPLWVTVPWGMVLLSRYGRRRTEPPSPPSALPPARATPEPAGNIRRDPAHRVVETGGSGSWQGPRPARADERKGCGRGQQRVPGIP
ncbi:DUF1707 domain-containing protein [Aciditerrimonas ferrireducens]|uniref:DUF1707 domain-containing protein n=1 Tax=Aciditerrimonas ferrireducens TaxID=667306 RepID=A0ABV6C1W4_9ACTN